MGQWLLWWWWRLGRRCRARVVPTARAALAAPRRCSLASKHPWAVALAADPAAALPPAPGALQPGKAARDSAAHAAERARCMARHVGGMRPTLLDATYGLDLVVPGLAGFARLVAWYAPGRKEGMLELRMF